MPRRSAGPQAPNFQAILNWVKQYRPDCFGQFEEICNTNEPGGRGDALLFLLATGFQAGRQYQINHPKLGVHSYHSDPPPHQEPVPDQT